MLKCRAPRSMHCVPATRIEDYAPRLLRLRADAIMYDLEDGVWEDDKGLARDLLSNRRDSLPIRGSDTYIRINPRATVHYAADLDLIRELEPEAVVMSKIHSADDVRELSDILDSHRRDGGKDIGIFLVIETLEAHLNRLEILRASKRGFVVTVGYEDLAAELDIERPQLDEPGPINQILVDTLISGRLSSIPLIDAVSRVFSNDAMEEFRREVEYGQRIGCCGKISIHPNQVAVINEVYADESLRIESERTVAAFHSLPPKHGIVIDKNGEMNGPPALKRARAHLKPAVAGKEVR